MIPSGVRMVRHLLARRPVENVRALVSYLILTTPLVYGDRHRLQISRTAIVNNALFNLASGRIEIHDHVVLGHNVSLLTGTHDPVMFGAARAANVPTEGRDIVIERGAWLASSVIVLGNCRVGENAVVASGSVVTHDVAPYTMVCGVPASPVRRLTDS